MRFNHKNIVSSILQQLSEFDFYDREKILNKCLGENRVARYYDRKCDYSQEWRPVVRQGYERYLVSNWGFVRHSSKAEDVILRPAPQITYARVALNIDADSNSQHFVHELVVESFILNKSIRNYRDQNANMVINHKDGDKWNPALHNLEIVTQSDNLIHAYENGLRSATKKEPNENLKGQ